MLNILEYIEQLLYFYLLTRFYKQPLNWTNITQIIIKIIKQDFCNLEYLRTKVGLISKTIIFVVMIRSYNWTFEPSKPIKPLDLQLLSCT